MIDCKVHNILRLHSDDGLGQVWSGVLKLEPEPGTASNQPSVKQAAYISQIHMQFFHLHYGNSFE